MDTDSSYDDVAQRVFRRHWLVRLALPALPAIAAVALISAATLFLFPHFYYAPLLLIFSAFPLLKLLRLYLAWLGYSVSVTAGSNILVERSGLLGTSKRLIPLTEYATLEYERPWWASILGIDVGDAIVGAVGGPFILSSMGSFSDLWTVLCNKGRTIPPKRPSAMAALLALLWRGVQVTLGLTLRSVLSLARTLRRYVPAVRRRARQGFSALVSMVQLAGDQVTNKLVDRVFSWLERGKQARQPAASKGPGLTVNVPPTTSMAGIERPGPATPHYSRANGRYTYRGEVFSSNVPSYIGFCAFCEQFVLKDKEWTEDHYLASDHSRRYYPDGVSDRVARVYLRRLRLAYVLIPVPNGYSRERLSCRIRSIDDIKHLVPDFSGIPNKVAHQPQLSCGKTQARNY